MDPSDPDASELEEGEGEEEELGEEEEETIVQPLSAIPAVAAFSGGGKPLPTVRFLKHNVFSEYDEWSDIADMYRVRAVPKFMLFSDGALAETFGGTSSVGLTRVIDRLLLRMAEGSS